MRHRYIVGLVTTVAMMMVLVLTVPPQNHIIIGIFHILAAVSLWFILLIANVKKRISAGISLVFLVVSALYVLKLLSFINIVLLFAIGLVGLVYLHTK